MNPLANAKISGLGGAPRNVPGFSPAQASEASGSSFAALLREQAASAVSAPKLGAAPAPAPVASRPSPAPRPAESREPESKPAESRAASRSNEPAGRKPQGANTGTAKTAQGANEAEQRARARTQKDSAAEPGSRSLGEASSKPAAEDRELGNTANPGPDGALAAMLAASGQSLNPAPTPVGWGGATALDPALQDAAVVGTDQTGSATDSTVPVEPGTRRSAGLSTGLEGLDKAGQPSSPELSAAASADTPLGQAGLDQEQGTIQLAAGMTEGGRSSFAAKLEQAQTLPFEALQGLQGLQSSTGSSEASGQPPAVLSLSPQLHSPEFAPEMAARLSVLTSEGVQRAELHLNPAEMGPVQIQIVVDGQQAQISFMSDQAETRAVLERSLPELASALRDNGLTLSGGGVFQQQREREGASSQQGEGSRGGRSREGGGEALEASGPPVSSAPRPPARARGVVDLYA
ncbi:MAG: flagellar hook-length control protein FliK [Roseateles sp.]